MANDDAVVVDPSDIAFDKRPTKPLSMGNKTISLEMELSNPDAVAIFLEAVATSVRERRRIKLVIE